MIGKEYETLARALGHKWVELYNAATGLYPQRLTSSGHLVEKAMLNAGVAFPMFSSVDVRIQEFAYRCAIGGRFEMPKRGFVGPAHLSDIKSAYPDKIAKLPDLDNGEWIEDLKIDPHASLGYFRIVADVPESKYLAPFPFKANSRLVFPTGRFITYVTIDELRACENPGYYEIIQGYQFIANDPGCHPYENFVNGYYKKKQELEAKDDPLHLPFKVMLNSMYGKTGETRRVGKRRNEMGNLFNPVIFAHIPGATRAQLYRKIIDNRLEKEVAFLATDSICATRNLGWNSDKLGEFSDKGSADDLFNVQNGINRMNDNWKERGIGNMRGRRIENTKIFVENGRVFMKLKVERVQNLKSAILQNKISEIGKFNEVIREIDLNADRKRLWLGRLASLNNDQFNDSMPLPLNHVKKEEI